jgi:anti-sigma factor RsiW
MTCDRFHEIVSDWLDGDIDATQRAALDAHVATCDACRALMADLRRVRQTAATLDRHTPPSRVWARIEQQLATDPRVRAAAARRAAGVTNISSARRTRTWSWRSPVLALAATLLLAVAGSVYLLHRWSQSPATPETIAKSSPSASSPGGTQPGNAQPSALVESIDSELQQAAAHYEKAITALEQVANASDSPLDPDVMTALHRNLDVIDKAIAESRVALNAEPTSRVAQQSLFDAFRRKVALLQDTIALMNELRKGDQAGAARVASGLNKS